MQPVKVVTLVRMFSHGKILDYISANEAPPKVRIERQFEAASVLVKGRGYAMSLEYHFPFRSELAVAKPCLVRDEVGENEGDGLVDGLEALG
jgi:hypothetical protein